MITVRLSVDAWIGGPGQLASADLATMFIAMAKILTDTVHPVIIPFSNQCQSDVTVPEVTLTLKSLNPHKCPYIATLAITRCFSLSHPLKDDIVTQMHTV